MATTDYMDEFLELWNQDGQEAERKLNKYLLGGLDEIVQAGSDFLAALTVAEDISNPVARWFEEWAYPTRITAQLSGVGSTPILTYSAPLFGRALTRGNLKNVLSTKRILERPSDGLQLKILSMAGIDDGAAWTTTVEAYGNTDALMANDTEPIFYDLVYEPWADMDDAGDGRAIGRYERSTYLQILADVFKIPNTRENTDYELVKNETEHQIGKLLEKLRRELAFAVMRGRPYYDSGYKNGLQAETPTLGGLHFWAELLQTELANPSVYVDKGGNSLLKSDMDDLMYNMHVTEEVNFGVGKWQWVTDPLTLKRFADSEVAYVEKTPDQQGTVGFGGVTQFHSKMNKSFPIMEDRYLRPGTMMLVNMNNIKYGYYKNDRLSREKLETQGRYKKWMLSFQVYGLVVRNARQSIGTIKGLPTS